MRSRVCLAVVAAVFVLSQAVPCRAQDAQTVRNRNEAFQRYDLHGHKVDACFCGWCDGDTACDWGLYKETLGYVGGIGLVIGLLCFLGLFVFLVSRYYCDCCGGREPTASQLCCFVDPRRSKFRGYKGYKVFVPKLLTFVVVVCALVLCILGWVYSSVVSDEAKSFADVCDSVATGTQGSIAASQTTVLDMAADFNYSRAAQLDSAFGEAAVSSANIFDAADTVNSSIDKYEVYRLVFVQFALAITMLVSVSALVSVFRNHYKLSLYAGIVSFFILTMAWIAFGFHTVFTFAAVDACNAMDKVRDDGVAYLQSPLSSLLACDRDSTVLGLEEATNATEAFRQAQLSDGCDLYKRNRIINSQGYRVFSDARNYARWCTTLDADAEGTGSTNKAGQVCECDSTLLSKVKNDWQYCDPTTCLEGARYQRVYELILNGTVSDSCEIEARAGSIPVRSCPSDSNCRDGCKTVAAEVIRVFDSALALDAVIDNTLKPSSQCDFLLGLIDDAYGGLCNDFIKAVDITSSVCLGLGILFLFGTPLMIVGFKRYNAENWAQGYIPRDQFGMVTPM